MSVDPEVNRKAFSVNPASLVRKNLEMRALQKATTFSSGDIEKVLLAHGDSIDKDLFKTLMSKTGHKSYDDVELVDALWGALDVNHDQEVDTKELILGLAVLSGGDLDHKLKLGFRIFDTNGDQFIQRDELAILVRAMSKVKYANNQDLEAFINEFVQKTFEKYDSNNDNQLSFDEFCAAAKESEETREFFTLHIASLA